MKRNNPEQRGAVLLLILLLLVVAGSSLALSAFNSNPALLTPRGDLQQQMQRAKDALLAYAAHSAMLHGNTRGPGFFPCPDTNDSDPDNDGIISDDSAATCAGYDAAATPLLGRLPRAIDTSSGRHELSSYGTGIDQQFWYAVGNRYVAIPSAAAANSVLRNAIRRTSTMLIDATSYRLTLDGTPGYVALIIAPGEALATQNRPNAPYNHDNYLEGTNGDGFAFVSGIPNDAATLNDQILGITLDEYMRAVGIHVVKALKYKLDTWHFANGHYPESSGYTDFPLEPSSPATQDQFQAVFHDSPSTVPLWLRPDDLAPPDQGNGENWPAFTHYLQVSASQAQMAFTGCPGMIYTIIYTVDFTAGITRAGDSC